MPSETDCLNDALGQTGNKPITGIDDGSPNANWCKVFYPTLRQGLLRSHHWNFAEARQQLAKSATVPTFEFSFAYDLPTDCLKIKEYNGVGINFWTSDPWYWTKPMGFYKIEGRQLLTNDDPVLLVFVKDVINPTIWDPLFYQVVATMLASKLAAAINKDTGMASMKMKEALGLMLPLAMATDGQEGTITPYQSDDLTWGR